jgi:hypothetical protein
MRDRKCKGWGRFREYKNILTDDKVYVNLESMKTQFSKLLAFVLILALTLSPISSIAADSPATTEASPQGAEPLTGEELGYGVGSFVASLFYTPLKVTYAGLGLMAGGLGYLITAGRTDVAKNIVSPAVRGNYVVMPSHLKGEEPLIFVGPADSPQPEQISSATSAPQP